MIRLSRSCLGAEEKAAVLDVLDDGYLGMGATVKTFEDEVADFIGSGVQVACCNSGTAALHLALAACDIGPGDEVLVPTITYVASFQAVSALGAKPIPVDVNDQVFIDLESAEQYLNERTKAIMPVHYASDSSQIADVYAFAKKHGLRVIEDAAHSFGGYRDNKRIGAEGDIICFSFDGIKNITCGEGGAVVSHDAKIIQRVKDARLLGIEKDTDRRFGGQRSWDFDVPRQGYRYHMSNLNAAIGLAQLKKVDIFAEQVRQFVTLYQEGLIALEQHIGFLQLNDKENHPHLLVILVKNGLREELRKFLQEKQIETGIHYFLNHKLSLYQSPYKLPNAEAIYEKLLTLPLHCELSVADVNTVVLAIKEFFDERA